jgi:hypothetical protein
VHVFTERKFIDLVVSLKLETWFILKGFVMPFVEGKFKYPFLLTIQMINFSLFNKIKK